MLTIKEQREQLNESIMNELVRIAWDLYEKKPHQDIVVRVETLLDELGYRD